MRALRTPAALALFFAACAGAQGDSTPSPAGQSASEGPIQRPYASLAQVMRAIPFTASNIVFDTQWHNPETEGAERAVDGEGASARYARTYRGWQVVEHNALALSEAANLMLIPGRLCENGRPVPVDREDFRVLVQALSHAGRAAYRAALSKNLEQMTIVSEQVVQACSNCHEVYRDKPEGQPRCVPPAP